MKVIILAAGKGSRLAPLTDNTPKPLVEVRSGKKIMDYIIDSLPESIEEIIIVTNYLSEKIKDHFSSNSKVKIVHQEKRDGTMGALAAAKEHIPKGEKFLVIQGDDIHEKNDIEEFTKLDWAFSFGRKIMPLDYFAYNFTEDNYMKSKRRQTEKELENGFWVASGMYMLDDSVFELEVKKIVTGEISLPGTIMGRLEEKPIKAFFENNWITVNTPEELESARKKLSS